MPDSVSDMRTTIQIVFTMVREAFLSRAALHLENLALRQQLAGVHRKSSRPSLCTADRLFWVVLSRMWILGTVYSFPCKKLYTVPRFPDFRLERLNKEYGTYILASGRTVREAGGEFANERVGNVTVRGRQSLYPAI